ncbi:MAG: cysteine desulfurase [Clostridia bacterium]|nr:cysteine desulfurase [Clostridia bacterium]
MSSEFDEEREIALEHYLDNAATTQVCPEAAEAALQAMTEIYGNPSSTHAKGREARKLLDQSRQEVADALGARQASEIVFTSCGSESDNWALLSGAESKKRQGRHIISSLVEHDAIRRSLEVLESRGFSVTRLKPDATGRIMPEMVREALREDTILVSLMMVNNETGAVTDIHAIADVLKKAASPALLHTDAVQAFKKVPFQARSLGADLISISGHKIHAPKGIGALYIKSGVKLKPLIIGGSQESERRAGTEPLPQIAAFAAACRQDAQIKHIQAMKHLAVEKLTALLPEMRYLETEAPHLLNISMPGWRSEVLMNFLESQGIYVSKSSACKQGKRSHVLEALDMRPEVIDGALRIGFSRFTTKEDILALADGLAAARGLAHR